MLEKKVIRIMIFLLGFCLLFESDFAHAENSLYGINQKMIPSRQWERITMDVAEQIHNYIYEKKDLRLKPIRVEVNENFPVKQFFNKKLEEGLTNHGIILSQQDRDAIFLSCYVTSPQMNLNGNNTISEGKIQLEEGLFVSRNTSDWIIRDFKVRGTDLSDQTDVVAIYGDGKPVQVDVSVSTQLSYKSHTFLSHTDIYHVRKERTKPKIASPSPIDKASKERYLRKKGRTFHVVD